MDAWGTLEKLCAPFDTVKWISKGGKELAYITARQAMNRLDEVLGPEGWRDEYEVFGAEGVLCKLYVYMSTDGAEICKCGIGGAAEMKELDDNEKSAESSAFKRAAVKFGIGRYLYRDGLPANMKEVRAPSPPGKSAPAKTAPSQERRDDVPKYDIFKLPPPGKAVFAWAKSMGDHYKFDLIPGMRKAGESLGVGSNFMEWDKETANQICLRVVAKLKTLPNYDGKLDHIAPLGPTSTAPQ